MISKNFKNILSLFSVELVVRLIGFAAVTYLARVLGKSNFGVINIGLAVLSYGMILGNSGLTLLGTRKVASGEEDLGALTSGIFKIRILLTIVITIIIGLIVLLFVQLNETAEVSLFYLFFLFPSAVLLEWFFQGRQKMGIIAIGRVLMMLAYFLFLIFFVKDSTDVIMTPIGWVVGGFLNALFLLIVFKKEGFSLSRGKNYYRSFFLLKEAFPLAAASIMAQVVIMFPIIFIGIILSEAEVGVYSAAYKIVVLFLIFDRVFNAVFYPKIVNSITNGSENIEELFNKVLKIITTFALSAGIFAVMSGDLMIPFVFGQEYTESIIIFKIITGYFIFTMINSVFGYTLIGMKKEKFYTISILFGMIIFFISGTILTHYYGSEGMAVGLILFEISSLIFMYAKLKNIININFLRFVFLPVVVSLTVLLPGLILLDTDLIIKLLLSVIVCIPLIAFVAGINKEDLYFLKRILV